MTECTFAKTFEEFATPMLAETKSAEETTALYFSCVEKLDAALAGLSEAELDLARAEGKWTIRQTAHHIVDGDDIWSLCIKAMIGNPGSKFVLDWYDQDPWVERMDYGKRPLEEALTLFRARREHMAEVLRHLPDAWDKEVQVVMQKIPEGLHWTVGFTVLIQACHSLWHIEQIRQTRHVHNRL